MIELHEFLMLLKSQHKEAQARIKELVEAPIMVLRGDQSKQYLPPTKVSACSGVFACDFHKRWDL